MLRVLLEACSYTLTLGRAAVLFVLFVCCSCALRVLFVCCSCARGPRSEGTTITRAPMCRYLTQVELRDDWAITELVLEGLVLAFGIICWFVTYDSDVTNESEENARETLLLVLGFCNFALLITLAINFISTRFCRGVRLIMDFSVYALVITRAAGIAKLALAVACDCSCVCLCSCLCMWGTGMRVPVVLQARKEPGVWEPAGNRCSDAQ
jgi:hypothetical protein